MLDWLFGKKKEEQPKKPKKNIKEDNVHILCKLEMEVWSPITVSLFPIMESYCTQLCGSKLYSVWQRIRE
jgi:hypothetical protein